MAELRFAAADDTSLKLSDFHFRILVVMDRQYAAKAIQQACGLVRLTADDRGQLRRSRRLRRHHLSLPQIADRVADLLAVHAAHDKLIEARDCGSYQRLGSCPATTHLEGREVRHA